MDLTGKIFGRLTVLSLEIERTKHKQKVYKCICTCGNLKKIPSQSLTSGHTKSCGCLQVENMSTHGKTKTPEFKTWTSMISRCSSKTHKSYFRYGGRGITVCERWIGKTGFLNFLEDIGERPTPKHSLDRIDNNKGYSAENCRWADTTTQARNKRNNNLITYKNITRCLTEWSEIINIPTSTLYNRLKNGWDVEKSFETPIIIAKRNKIVKNSLEYKGEIKCIAEWCRIYNIATSTFHKRLKKGMSVQEAIETPINIKNRRTKIL